MTFRVEVLTHQQDGRAATLLEKLRRNFPVKNIKVADVYTVDKYLPASQRQMVASALHNGVTQAAFIHEEEHTPARYLQEIGPFDWAVETGFLPGVTDNTATTTRQLIEDLLDLQFDEKEAVYSSRLYLVQGEVSDERAHDLAENLINPLIQRVHIKKKECFSGDGGMGIVVPRVTLKEEITVTPVNLNVPGDELESIGKKGVPNADGTHRGPLGLSLLYLEVIRDYFKKEGRPPNDIELETLAQTWSEHCKHTIFANAIDDVKDGIYRHYIKRATREVRQRRGTEDICVSVFKDNAGAIVFDDNWLICDKVETHNTPSALDPFGGSITGIVGVNRDCLGFGKGARPIMNRYGFCLADPNSKTALYRDAKRTQPMLSARAIMDGVIHGIEVGGNCSGIPTPQGFIYFDERYRGKPLLFAGTVGLIPREINGKPSHEKAARPGDKIVMLGGRVGKDGIHGATFSSEALDEGSPVSAVQIGDPVTQKKFTDMIIRHAREQDLYHSITDNGAGGLSSSVGEMGEEAGGFVVELEKVPLKYPGLQPWEIWISESQERMTLAIPEQNVAALQALCDRHDVEMTVIGDFTGTGRATITWHGDTIMDMDMTFLHDGLPKETLTTTYTPPQHDEPDFPCPEKLNDDLLALLSCPNICSREFLATLYDHEVQGTSVIKPLQGIGRVSGETTVSRPVEDSLKGAVISHALYPRYSDVDTYHMAAAAIDTAIRNTIAVGGRLEHLALLDNFCWCSADEPERLGQLRKAAEACYDYAIAYGVPYVSGKDSMFNDFKGYDTKGQPTKISVPPTLLISSLGVIEDVTKCISIDAKIPGDLVYILGETKDETGGSEYFAIKNHTGNKVPQVMGMAARKLYEAFTMVSDQQLVASALSIGLGGIGVALARKAMAGMLGLQVDLRKIPRTAEVSRRDTLLFSESQSRLLVTVSPENRDSFEELFEGCPVACIGEVTEQPRLMAIGGDRTVIDLDVDDMLASYQKEIFS